MRKLTLSKQILVVIFSSIGFAILFSFFFIHYLYSNLYLSSIEEAIIHQGKQTASHYHYGELSEEIIQKIEWYNIVSEYEVIVVDNLDELSSYFPYKVNYETLINKQDQTNLERGQYIWKEGFVEEFNREILGAIFPIKGEHGLIGFIYIYIPLTTIQDIFSKSIPLLLVVGIFFFLSLFLVVNRVWISMFKPLQNLQSLAQEVSKGNYTKQIEIVKKDEIGQLTKAFNKMNQSLSKQEERKIEFTSNVVHELRTPLTYISGYTTALKEKIYTSTEDAEEYLLTIEKETERLSKLINDLADLNHLQEDLYSINKQPIVIAQLLFDTLDLFLIHKKEKQLQLNLNIQEDLIMLGDAKRIHQVFYNTIDNAIKYASQSSILTISLTELNKNIQFKINNHGATINKNDINRIGERFFRTDKARTRLTGGTGLGLSIVKEIVRLHDGDFHIRSSKTSGTTVTIELPRLNIEGDD